MSDNDVVNMAFRRYPNLKDEAKAVALIVRETGGNIPTLEAANRLSQLRNRR